VEFCQRHQLDPSAPIVSLLPGSRHKEVVRILPPLLKAAALLKSKQPEVQSVLVVAPSRSEAEVRYIIAKQHSSLDLLIVREETREALAASAVAVVASGTATLEAALLETPMVIVYKESFVNWHTLGRLIKAEHYGLPNLIAGKRLVTELIQNDFTSEKVVDEVLRLLVAETNANVRVELREAVEKLGNAGASERAATRILEFVSQ
jgi:lipid-A-disaccharide synthase